MKRKLLFSFFLLNVIFSNAQVTVIDSIISDGIYRNYRLYIPASYNGMDWYPLIINLHGYTSNAAAQQAYSNFSTIADTAHFLMVYPNGTTYNGQPYWNAFGVGANDIQFLSNLIDSLSLEYNIDANRVYSCGMSNGGYMSYTLACALNNKIAAIASVTGSMSPYTKSTCSPARPVPVMEIHGNADGTVPYNGTSTSLPIDSVVKYWRVNNNCNSNPVFNSVPNVSTTDGCTAEHYVYSGGTNGSSVELYKIIGGGHTWPGTPYWVSGTNEDFNASEKIWLFFRKYKLNTLIGINEIQNDQIISIYPNPVTDIVTIEGEFSSVVFTDLEGKILIETTGKNINISSFAKGIYFVLINSNKGKVVKKMVKI
jgi:polyhydroxybutyrate depolymerase